MNLKAFSLMYDFEGIFKKIHIVAGQFLQSARLFILQKKFQNIARDFFDQS